jgi:hypothetical protein
MKVLTLLASIDEKLSVIVDILKKNRMLDDLDTGLNDAVKNGDFTELRTALKLHNSQRNNGKHGK